MKEISEMKKFSKKTKNRIIQMISVSLVAIITGAIMLGVGLNKNVVLDMNTSNWRS